MTKTEEYNLKEEIKEEVKNALRNGIDNEGCAVYRASRKDHYSPRGKAIVLDNGYYEKILYKCNLCKACGEDLCNTFLKARQVLVLRDKEMNANKKMIENVKRTGNIYGIDE
jgi:ArsR family metal-binding transcriptional regulator